MTGSPPPLVVYVHFIAALAALVIGALQLARPKGTGGHRVIGWVWIALMMTVAISSLWIPRFLHFTWIHLFTLFVMVRCRSRSGPPHHGEVAGHAKGMRGIYVGGLIVAGVFRVHAGARARHLLWKGVWGVPSGGGDGGDPPGLTTMQRAPARPGDPVDAIETPALVLDLDAFERNLDAMAAASRSAACELRPHAKTHKTPEIALRQIARGAVGICCQKVSEAEAFVAGRRRRRAGHQRGRRRGQAAAAGGAGAQARDRRAASTTPRRSAVAGGGRAGHGATLDVSSKSTSARTAAASRPASRGHARTPDREQRRTCASPACRPTTARRSTCARR